MAKETFIQQVKDGKELVQNVRLANKHFKDGSWDSTAITESLTPISKSYNVTPQFIESLLKIQCSQEPVADCPSQEIVKDLNDKVTELKGNFAVATMVHLASCSPEDFETYFGDLTRTAYYSNKLSFQEIDLIGQVFDIEVEPRVIKI